MTNKYYKCPFCNKKYLSKIPLYTHMTEIHGNMLSDMSPARVYFNYKNHKTSGKCVICGKETPFMEDTEKYARICSEKCKKKYVEQFRKRMKNTYGKENLLNDPDQQKKMLESRRISGKYKWSDGTLFSYVGSYEKDMLRYIDKVLKLGSKDIITPAPHVIHYKYKGKERFYIPDIYLVPFNLLIEVKGSNNHYQQRDIEKEKAKDKAATRSKFNYVKVLDKNYKILDKELDSINNSK